MNQFQEAITTALEYLQAEGRVSLPEFHSKLEDIVKNQGAKDPKKAAGTLWSTLLSPPVIYYGHVKDGKVLEYEYKSPAEFSSIREEGNFIKFVYVPDGTFYGNRTVQKRAEHYLHLLNKT